MFDGEAFGTEVVEAVKAYVDRVAAPLRAEIDALKRELAERPAPKDGKDADPEALRGMVADAVAEAVAVLPVPKDGAPGRNGHDVEDIQVRQDGRTVELKFTVGDVVSSFEIELPETKDGEPGKDADPAVIRQLVAEAVAEIPAPKDGKDGEAGPVVAAAIKDHSGELILTLTDGTLLRTGIFDGAPGLDGAGFDDFSEALSDDGRSIVRRYVRGDQVREFVLPMPGLFDQGVYRSGDSYLKGDVVTLGGSLWIAQKETDAKPGENDAWRLAVKRGRDGRDLAPAERPKAGPITVGVPAAKP